tara:strand:- start:2682 stop:3530 length:849 start_codon:yes stop_codon:yes gene_type:complete
MSFSIQQYFNSRFPIHEESQIYLAPFSNDSQKSEIAFRDTVATQTYSNYLNIIAKHHSIPVMDREVERVLKNLPKHAVILDIGGCWGWHWRSIDQIRPDVKIVILDFSLQNLFFASNILKHNLNHQIFLVNGDALSLPFSTSQFDLVWSVQTFQHIPNYRIAFQEVYRVLRKGSGLFVNYTLNDAFLVRSIYRLLCKKYVLKGNVGPMYLERSSYSQKQLLASIFRSDVRSRYSEILFTPELRFPVGSKEASLLGRIDSYLSGSSPFFSTIARQQSYEVYAS